MSLPFKRRIVARAALLVAAGAAPLVGMAGTAGAVELPKTSGLNGVNALDGALLQDTAGAVSTKNATGAKTVKSAVPQAGKTVKTVKGVGKTLSAPAAARTVDKTTRTTGSLVGTPAKATKNGIKAPTFSPVKGLTSLDKLTGSTSPVKGLPLA